MTVSPATLGLGCDLCCCHGSDCRRLLRTEEPSPTALWAGIGLVLVLVVHSILGWREGESAAPHKCAQAQKQAENVSAQC